MGSKGSVYYLLFSGDNYYPLGGWRDFVGEFETEVNALKAAFTQAATRNAAWAQIVKVEVPVDYKSGLSTATVVHWLS